MLLSEDSDWLCNTKSRVPKTVRSIWENNENANKYSLSCPIAEYLYIINTLNISDVHLDLFHDS